MCASGKWCSRTVSLGVEFVIGSPTHSRSHTKERPKKTSEHSNEGATNGWSPTYHNRYNYTCSAGYRASDCCKLKLELLSFWPMQSTKQHVLSNRCASFHVRQLEAS